MSKNKPKFFSRVIICFLCALLLGAGLLNPVIVKNSPTYLCSKQEVAYSLPSLRSIFKNLFKKKEKNVPKNRETTSVYLGGFPLGFTLSCSGVVVVAISNSDAGDLKEGDIITKLDDEDVCSAGQILTFLNREENRGKTFMVTYTRAGEVRKTHIQPIFDANLNMYKLGIWIRDNAAGVGTLTYIKKDNFRFGALGHPVCDIDTGSLMPVNSGNIFKCNVVGYRKGVKGKAGELKGLFLRNGSVLGTLDKNNEFGVYGTFDKEFLNNYNAEEVLVCPRSEVKCGKAKIRCTIDGTVPKDYDIEIVKTYFQDSKSNKSMFIRVTDKQLLSLTGGIVQGMSGSPIIQNGRLVGAVTHVFVSDPSKGYGIYADWMIEN